MTTPSLLSYYQQHEINPVPIGIETVEGWQAHLRKRRNLYERHLGIPMSLLRDRPVLEFGCNSGENPLVLAHHGARLTLVEPNEQVYDRLRTLFAHFGYEEQIEALVPARVDNYNSEEQFPLVVAEGFINHLDDREAATRKILRHVSPGGRAIISFDCLYGHFLEMTRKLVFWRACRVQGVEDGHSPEALDVARRLFLEDFSRINTSRPFEAWWQDVLLNPFVSWSCLWTYEALLKIAEEEGCEFLSTSPRWSRVDDFQWHKNVADTADRHRAVLQEWQARFAYILTGLPPTEADPAPDPEAVDAVSALVRRITGYVEEATGLEQVDCPMALRRFLAAGDERTQSVGDELTRLYEAVQSDSFDGVCQGYLGAPLLRTLWGAPYHYISFARL